MLEFKKLVRTENRLIFGVLILGWVALAYYLPNKFPFIPALRVPTTLIDDLIPISPPWVWVYFSYYFYLISSFILVRDERNLNVLAYSYIFAAAISSVIFFVIPTTLVRDLYPILDGHGFSAWAMTHLRSVDESTCCAPSGHITMTTIAGLSIWRESKRAGRLAAAWALLITFSTMATKQHYFIDVITGFIFGVAVFAVFSKATFRDYFTFSSRTASS